MTPYKKNIYDSIVEDIMKEKGNGALEVEKETIRVLSFIGTDKSGDDVYRTIRPGCADGHLISKDELMDKRNYMRIPVVKYDSLFQKKSEKGKKQGRNLLLSYKGVLVCPDFSCGEGDAFLRTLSEAVGCFKPEMTSEADCLYLASLFADMDHDLLIAYVDSRSQKGVCRPFACYEAPKALDNAQFTADVNSAGDYEVSSIVKKRDAEIVESMNSVWDVVRRDLDAVYGEGTADMYLKADTDSGDDWFMEKGDVCLMQVDPMDIRVLCDIGEETGFHKFFKVSPVSCTHIMRDDLYAKEDMIAFTKGVKRLCGAAGFYDYLLSGTDKDGRAFIAVPKPTLLLRLCMLDGLGRMDGGNEMIRNILLDRAIRKASSDEFYVYRENVHSMQSGNTIFLCGVVMTLGKGIRHDYVKEFDEICVAAATHGMALTAWNKTKGVYTVRFEVLDSVRGIPFEIFHEGKAPRITCGMEYSFSPSKEKAFEIGGVFYVGKGAFYFQEKNSAVCRANKQIKHPAASLVESFFDNGAITGNSIYANLLSTAGFPSTCTSSKLEDIFVKTDTLADDLKELIAVKRGDISGRGRNDILYTAVKAKVRQALMGYSDEEISSWTVSDYLAFMAGFTADGRDFGERSRLMACIERTFVEA